MSTRSKHSQSTRVSRAVGAISGIKKYLSSFPSFVLAAATFTPAELVALLQAYATAVTALQLLHAQLHTAATSVKSQGTQIDAVLSALESFVVNMFGAHSEQVTEFGFTPRKVTVLTAAQKAASRAKGAATRKAKKAALASVNAPAAPPALQTVSNGAPAKA